MQDSIEDYIRITSNIKEAPAVNKDILVTLQHKIKCENYAQRIVLYLIEGKHKPEPFLWSLNFINPDNYQDVVEERTVSNLCGYPVCGKRLPQMPKKQFHISTKLNKVYDITERKNFCSNYCYQASCFIKEQIDTSPLWLRTPQNFVQCKLLDEKKFLSPGIEVDQGIAKVKEDQIFTSVSSFTEACLDEAQQIEKLNEPDFPDFEETDSSSLKPKSILKTKVGAKYAKASKDKKEDDESEDKKQVRFSNVQAKAATSEATSQKEIDDLNKSIAQICLSMNIKLKTGDNFGDVEMKKAAIVKDEDEIEERVKPVVVDEARMEKAIAKVNASEKCKVRTPILVQTNLNPEDSKNREKIMIYVKDPPKASEAPEKYTRKIIEKIKTPEKDDLKKVVIEKVKKMECKKVNDDLQKVLEKLKAKENKLKAPILIETVLNPEAEKAAKKLKHLDVKDVLKPQPESLELFRSVYKHWLTLDSYIYLHGEDAVKAVINEDSLEDFFSKLKVEELEKPQQVRYMNICRKMQMMELAEEQFDNALLGKGLKPPPDFGQLRKDGKEMNLKVKAYFAGTLYEKNDSNFGPEDDEEIVAPLVDVSSRNAMRKKIFINSATKFIQQHVKDLGLEEGVVDEVQSFMKTFKLEADNIVFRPQMWSLIAIVLIFILSMRDESLICKLNAEQALAYKGALFERINNCDDFVEEVKGFLGNIDLFVREYITNDE